MATVTAAPVTHALPRSLAATVPWIWSRILFSGESRIDSRIRVLSLIAVVVLPALLLYPTLSYRLLEPDEGRYAEIPREMLERGDWVVPHLQGQPYLDKPPLMYWLVMLSYSIFGVSDWAARIPPALAIHGAILSLYLVGRRSIGERGAFWAALLLSVTPGFVTMGRLLILDGLLAACTTIAVLAAVEAVRGETLKRGWWILAAVAVGFGVLTKGPVALILVAIPIWLHRRLAGSGSAIGWKNLTRFLGVALAINLPWYAAIGLREPQFLRYFFWDHNVLRFVQPFDHIRPVWFYLPILIGGMLPASLLGFGFLRFLLSGSPDRSQRRTPELGFFLLAGGWCVFFFSMAGSKLPTYILPAFPLLMLAFGAYVASRPRAVVRFAAVIAVFGLLVTAQLHLRSIPWYAKVRSPMGEPEKVAKYCGDPNQPILCFPRSCDSVGFYLKRDDLRAARSKDSREFIAMLQENPRTVVLFTHRHSLEALRFSLPPNLKIVEVVSFRREKNEGEWFDLLTAETPWGLCDLAVVERQ
jgi:4-amino-4-deoxy-L-arabinose transferase-like glycosyltransferase